MLALVVCILFEIAGIAGYLWLPSEPTNLWGFFASLGMMIGTFGTMVIVMAIPDKGRDTETSN
jgi:hypothetical protein